MILFVFRALSQVQKHKTLTNMGQRSLREV